MGALFLSAEAAGASTTAPSYVVQPGDTLSAIAARHGLTWPTLAEANHLANPNLIFPGQVIVLDPPTSASSAISTHTVSHTATATDPDGDGDVDVATPTTHTTHTYSTPVHTSRATSSSATSSSSVTPTSGFQACVIQRESSGNPNVMNSSGHYGLYQFSLSTWERYGGSASTFGHASAAQQTAVFNNAMAAGGAFNWAPYDGC